MEAGGTTSAQGTPSPSLAQDLSVLASLTSRLIVFTVQTVLQLVRRDVDGNVWNQH